jgi:hypothetical protein
MNHASAKSKFRHYVNQGRMLGKIDRLLGDFAWGTVAQVIAAPASSRLKADARQSLGPAPHAAAAS